MSEPAACRLKFTHYGSWPRKCRGAVAIEFALVFVLFFSLFYAIVAYGLVLAIQQSLTLAAEEGARAAVKDAPSAAARVANADAMAKSLLGWLPVGAITVSSVQAPCVADPATPCVTVTVNYNYAGYPLVPSLPLLGVAIPATLSATATVQY